MIHSRVAVTMLVLGAVGCRSGDQPVPQSTDVVQTEAIVPDSLAVTAPGGVEVWFTDWRGAEDSTGVQCVERVMEIRTSEDTLPVPLLYTGVTPSLINDSTIRARIWLNCKPGNTYDVDLRTGFPTVVNH